MFFDRNFHTVTVYDIISNFIIISVYTENSYELWVYLYNRIFIEIVYLHIDPIKTKAILQLISSLYKHILRVKGRTIQKKEQGVGHLMYSIFYTGEV